MFATLFSEEVGQPKPALATAAAAAAAPLALPREIVRDLTRGECEAEEDEGDRKARFA